MVSLLKAESITKVFTLAGRELEVLKGISLEVQKGEFLSLTGKSGSGKTTLMNILGCLDLPTLGNYFLEDKSVIHLSSDELAHIRNKKIGFVFQQFNLLPDLNALDNVALPQLYAGISEAQAREKAAYFLDLVDLSERLDHYPYQLSGGQQQRVAIARALVNDPLLILADEPTGNLDSKTGDKIFQLFVDLNTNKNITIVIVTHDQLLAEKTNRVIRLVDGQVAEDVPGVVK